MSAAAFSSSPARTSTGCRFQSSNAFHAASTACSTCARVPRWKRPRSCSLCAGLMESNVFSPVMRWPPMTSGTSRPNSSFTFRRADSIAALFSGLLKSVSGSFLNSVRVGISLRPPACSGDGMYSKSPPTATLLLTLALAACSSALPWQNEPIGQEVNVAFTVRKNLVVLPSVTIDGRSGRFLLGTAEQRTVVDAHYAPTPAPARSALRLNQREALQFTPVVADLHGVADAIVGADVWGQNAIIIDYRAGLLTFSRLGVERSGMTVFPF